jgi:hypothetical protein
MHLLALSLNFPGPEHTWGQRTAITLHFVNVPPTCRRFKCACWPWKCIERRPHFGCRNPIVMQRAFHMPVVHLSYAIHTPDHTPTTNDRLGVVFAALYTSGPPAKLQWIETPLLAEVGGIHTALFFLTTNHPPVSKMISLALLTSNLLPPYTLRPMAARISQARWRQWRGPRVS